MYSHYRFRTEVPSGTAHGFEKFRIVDTDQLGIGSCRVCQRAQYVENCPDSDLFSHRGNVLHRGMEIRRKHEADAYPLDCPPNLFRFHVEVQSKSFQDVGASAFACERAIPVFGHWNACGSDDEGHCRANVERLCLVSSRPTRVEETSVYSRVDPLAEFSHHLSEGCDLIHRLTLFL